MVARTQGQNTCLDWIEYLKPPLCASVKYTDENGWILEERWTWYLPFFAWFEYELLGWVISYWCFIPSTKVLQYNGLENCRESLWMIFLRTQQQQTHGGSLMMSDGWWTSPCPSLCHYSDKSNNQLCSENAATDKATTIISLSLEFYGWLNNKIWPCSCSEKTLLLQFS